MKITKPGKLPDGHGIYRGECRLCGCRVEASRDEVLSGYSGADSRHGYFINCPTEGCLRQIDMVEVLHRGRKDS